MRRCAAAVTLSQRFLSRRPRRTLSGHEVGRVRDVREDSVVDHANGVVQLQPLDVDPKAHVRTGNAPERT